jgi:hypothetical protein
MPTTRTALPFLALAALIAPAACVSNSPSASTAAAAAREASAGEPLPALRTGALARIDNAQAVEGRVSARGADDRFEILAIDLSLPVDLGESSPSDLIVSVDGASSGPHAFASSPEGEAAGRRGAGEITVWIRRPRADRDKPVAGAIFTPHHGSDPGRRVPFHAAADPAVKSDPKLGARWARALSTEIRERGSSPWHRFAADRVESAFSDAAAPPPASGATRWSRPPRADLEEIMDTTTGAMSIQEALQSDRPLLLRTARDKATVPIAQLTPPKATAHPWEDLLRSLGKTAPAEPLAADVPAEFYYLRAADLGVLFQLSDQLDAWGSPIANALDREADARDLSLRYETQLGLARTAAAREFGKEVVAEVAIAGSDPYLREGSDVSVLFRVKQRALFDAGLAGTLATRSREHGGVAAASLTYDGVTVRIATSNDGAVRQHRATLGDVEIVSNSLGAVKRILDTAHGKHARLADEKDFAYLLARDAGTRADALGFMGDRFVGEVIGPRQKVLEARRQIALSELMTPGFAALLHGWVTGRSPASAEELFASKLLAKDELSHAGGAPIAWRPGEAARSLWGTPASLTPLIDLPQPDLVTEAERDAYQRFSRGYENYWSTYIDPAALRIALDPGPSGGTTLTADLRVLPLIDGTDYREIEEVTGDARVQAPPLGQSGARAVVGIGRNARIRRELTHMAHGVSRRHEIELDFLGDWAMVGCDDRPAIAEAVAALDRGLPQRPDDDDRAHADEIALAARSPVYAAIGIKSMAGATLALGAAHGVADEVLPGAIRWEESGKERDVHIVRVTIAADLDRPAKRGEEGGEVAVFYALTSGVFLISPSEPVLRRLVGDVLDGHAPSPAAPKTGSQMVVDLSADKHGAITTVLSWLLTEELLEASDPSRALAEALLVGAKDRAADPAAARSLALAYFGAAPVPPEGGAYTLGADGVRDPQRGTPSAPLWPALPVAGGAVDRLLGAVGGFRSEIAFDHEGPGKGSSALQSLHARVTLGLRKP